MAGPISDTYDGPDGIPSCCTECLIQKGFAVKAGNGDLIPSPCIEEGTWSCCSKCKRIWKFYERDGGYCGWQCIREKKGGE